MRAAGRRRAPGAAGLAALLAAAAGAAAAQPDPAGPWRFELRHDRHADALALRHFDDAEEHLSPRRGDNVAWIDDEVRAGRRVGAWTWSVLGRARATLEASDDALHLVDQVENRRRPAEDRRFDVAARLRGFSGWGLALAHDFRPAAGWSLRVEGQALSLQRWRDRDITGRVDWRAADGSYGLRLTSTETDDRLDFPFQRSFDSRGAALLFGATIAWRDGTRRASLTLRDIGWLRWSGVPQQHAVLDTDTASVDDDGYLVYEPLIQGRNGQRGRTARAQPDALVQIGWRPVPRTEIEAGAWWVAGTRPLPRLGVSQRFGGSLMLGARWGIHERRVGFDAGWRGWRLAVAADRPGGAARSRMFTVSYGMSY